MEFRELLTDCRNRKSPAKVQRRKGNEESELGRASLLLCFHLRLRKGLTEKKSQYNLWHLFFASLRETSSWFFPRADCIGPAASPDDAHRHPAYCDCRRCSDISKCRLDCL